MRKSWITEWLALVMVMAGCGGSVREVGTQPGDSALSVNYREIVSKADFTYSELKPKIIYGLPIGNGKMAGLVWAKGNGLEFQLNRSGVFGNNSYSSLQKGQEYAHACGKVEIDFGAEVFDPKQTHQHMSYYDALGTIEGNGLRIRALAVDDPDVIAIEIDDQRPQPREVSLRLKMLRPPLVKRKNHRAASLISEQPRSVMLRQVFEEPSRDDMPEGDHYCSSVLMAGGSGRKTQSRKVDERTIELQVKGAKGKFTFFVAGANTLDKDEDIVAIASRDLGRASDRGFAELLEENKQKWHDFWSRSFISLHSDDGDADLLQRCWTGWLYNLACTSRGDYAPHWNGQLWQSGGDWSNFWNGPKYWLWNLQSHYRACWGANHLELAQPLFNLYYGAYENAGTAARQEWGAEGIFLPEVMPWNGLERLPEEIAAELRAIKLGNKPAQQISPGLMKYIANVNDNSSRWNWTAAREDFSPYLRDKAPYSYVTHIFSSGAKVAWRFWLAYEYTLDRKWLRERAYPMLKGMAEFYRTFPHVIKGKDGRYHIHRVNNHEPVWGGRDTHEELCAMRAMFALSVRASQILEVDEELRGKWQERLENLTSLPLSNESDAAAFLEHAGGQPTWAQTRKPYVHIMDMDSATYTRPAVDYDLWTPETKDPESRRIIEATIEAAKWYQDLKQGNATFVLSEIPTTIAMLGRADEVKRFLPNQLRGIGWRDNVKLLPNYMQVHEFFGDNISLEGLGYSADNLQLALCQSFPPAPGEEPVIRVFPAWPREWEASFKLAARRGFLVSSSMKKGNLKFVEIFSQLGGECRIRNPWQGVAVRLHRNGTEAEKLSGNLLKFETAKTERILIVQSGV